MDGHAVSPFDLSWTLVVGGGLLVPYYRLGERQLSFRGSFHFPFSQSNLRIGTGVVVREREDVQS